MLCNCSSWRAYRNSAAELVDDALFVDALGDAAGAGAGAGAADGIGTVLALTALSEDDDDNVADDDVDDDDNWLKIDRRSKGFFFSSFVEFPSPFSLRLALASMTDSIAFSKSAIFTCGLAAGVGAGAGIDVGVEKPPASRLPAVELGAAPKPLP